MAKKTPTNEVRLTAKKLYISGDYTLEEIAHLTGKTRQTISRWAKEDQWQELKIAQSITPEQLINQWMSQIHEINEAIAARPIGERRATSEQADVMSKLRKNIKEMQREIGIVDITEALKRFLVWLRPLDSELAIKFNDLMNAFVQDEVSRIKMKR